MRGFVEEAKKSYSQTLNLSKTSFPIKPKFTETESSIIQAWESCGLYKKNDSKTTSNKRFVMHDGPPYANGEIHMGHVLNKVLKDVVARFKRKAGYNVFFRPGWDCHGLPIEKKLLEKLSMDSRKADQADRVKLKSDCRNFAQDWIEKQIKDFKSLGIMAEFENPYSTMAFEYEAATLEVFAKFYEKGLISRREKTVPWCFVCKTTLSAAEIEYKDRQDPSLYVMFKIEKDSKLERAIISKVHDLQLSPESQISVLVWTTTPWTLPFNRALVIKPETKYCLVEHNPGKYFVAGQALVEQIASKTQTSLKVVGTLDSNDLLGGQVLHPTHSMRVPLIQDKEISSQDGTAVMHCAPGCGQEDYLIGLREGLEVACFVDASGCYTEAIGIPELVGMSVVKANIAMVKILEEKGLLFSEQKIMHSYPHCWRCKTGLIFRATRQWFCNLDASKIKEKAIESLEKMEFIPHWGKNRLEAFLQTRTEWCISRQRIWGVPIPALICKVCDNEYIDGELIELARKNIAKEGIEFWDKITIDQIESAIPKQACSCGLSQWKLEKDILDVWFDSGSSNWAVLQKDNIFPADLYLEGSDQHRGWFQTSLLCSLVANDSVPTKAILTHGYITDAFKQKLSKSSGKAQSATDLIKKYGADVIRLWACSTDYQKDVPLSEAAIENAQQAYNKIRNTMRFAIANIEDFQVQENSDEYIHFTMLDFLIIFKLRSVIKKCLEGYQNYDFTTVFTRILNFCNTDLSAGYYDSLKDRLYTLAQGDETRRSGQKTLALILEFINGTISPMAPFLAHEAQEAIFKNRSELVVTSLFANLEKLDVIIEKQEAKLIKNTAECRIISKFDTKETIALLQEIKDSVFKAVEILRQNNLVKGSLEAGIKLTFNKNNQTAQTILNLIFALDQSFEKSKRFFEDYLILSSVEVDVVSDMETWFAIDAKALCQTEGFHKCPRCWRWIKEDGTDGLCQRCLDIL